MAMPVSEIREWLDTLNDDDQVGVDDGGLCLQVVDDSASYCEIGGIPEEEEGEEAEDEPDPPRPLAPWPSPRNLASCFHLNPAQVEKVEKIMNRSHEGIPAYMELPEGPGEVNVCWIYGRDLLEIGTITPEEAFRL